MRRSLVRKAIRRAAAIDDSLAEDLYTRARSHEDSRGIPDDELMRQARVFVAHASAEELADERNQEPTMPTQ